MPNNSDLSAPAAANGDKIVYLLKPRGFCAGVVRAVDIVELALQVYGPPIYVRKEIVHNRYVVDDLAARGAVFVEELDEVPIGGRAVFSAHGVAPAVREAAEQRRLRVIDATCPLVTKVHLEAVRFAVSRGTILLIGHRDHDEVIGTLGEAPGRTVVVSSAEEARSVQVTDPENVYYLTQTTLSLDEAGVIIDVLEERFPGIQGPPAKDICYATENRQRAVKQIASKAELLLVIGSQNSSNSQRLVEVGEKRGMPGHLLDDETQADPAWFEGVDRVALTAGASAPDVLVRRIVRHLAQFGYERVEEVEVIEEDVMFALPPELAAHQGELTRIANT